MNCKILQDKQGLMVLFLSCFCFLWMWLGLLLEIWMPFLQLPRLSRLLFVLHRSQMGQTMSNITVGVVMVS